MGSQLSNNSNANAATEDDGNASNADMYRRDSKGSAIFTLCLPILAWIFSIVALFVCQFLILETTLKFSYYDSDCYGPDDCSCNFEGDRDCVHYEVQYDINLGLAYTCSFARQTDYWFHVEFPLRDAALYIGMACSILSIALGGLAIFRLPLVDSSHFLVDFPHCCLASGFLMTLTIAGLGTKYCQGADVFCEDIDLPSIDEVTSDYCVQECKLGVGAYLAIVSSILWFVAAFGTCRVRCLREENRVASTDPSSDAEMVAESAPETEEHVGKTEAVEGREFCA